MSPPKTSRKPTDLQPLTEVCQTPPNGTRAAVQNMPRTEATYVALYKGTIGSTPHPDTPISVFALVLLLHHHTETPRNTHAD